jgi:MoxR-like ATPase
MAQLTKNQLKVLVNTQARTDRDYSVSSKTISIPFADFNTGETTFAMAYVMHHNNAADSKEHTTVIAHRGNDEWFVWCGDKYLTGLVAQDDVEDSIEAAVSSLPEANREVYKGDLRAVYATFEENSGCNNSRLASNLSRALDSGKDIEDITRGSSSLTCKHIQNMFAQMGDIDEITKEIEKAYKTAFKVSKNAKSDSAIADALDNFGFQGEALFIAGPGGHGKTHTVKAHAENKGFNFVELQGHGQIEAIDMYGYDKKHGDLHVWFDGPISQAARSAASGVKTMLFIDEFVNIPMRETAGLKAAFEPYKGHYYFQTSRIASVTDGIAVMEEIKVPVANLQIVAAANIGSGYASEDMDKALKQRFMILHYEAEDAKVRKVLTSVCKEKSFPLVLVDKLMKFKSMMELKVEEGLVPEAPTMRHLSRKFLGLMKEADDLEMVAMTQILQFVEFDVDGKPVAEQVEMIEEIIEMTLA